MSPSNYRIPDFGLTAGFLSPDFLTCVATKLFMKYRLMEGFPQDFHPPDSFPGHSVALKRYDVLIGEKYKCIQFFQLIRTSLDATNKKNRVSMIFDRFCTIQSKYLKSVVILHSPIFFCRSTFTRQYLSTDSSQQIVQYGIWKLRFHTFWWYVCGYHQGTLWYPKLTIS